MSRELIYQLYAHTALWLWPYLWLEIIRMQRFLAARPDADDPRVLYEIRVTQWGGLRLIQLTHDFGPDPDAWMNKPNITGDLLATDAFVCRYVTFVRSSLRRQGPSLAAPLCPALDPCLRRDEWRDLDSLYLDPG